MIAIKKQWLEAVPWDSVVQLNHALCRDKQLDPGQSPKNPKAFEAARQLWERTAVKTLTLKAVLDACRQCSELSPFTYNNGNTFAAIAKTLVESLVADLAPVEAHIARTTVGHYVAGLIGRAELAEVLGHFEKKQRETSTRTMARPAAAPATAPAPQVP